MNCDILEGLDYPWSGSNPRSEVFQGLLNLIEQNPFGAFEEMELNGSNKWRPYDREQILRLFQTRPEASYGARARSPYYRDAGIVQRPSSDGRPPSYGAGIVVADAYLDNEGALMLLTFMQQVALYLPRFAWGWAKTYKFRSDFISANNLPYLPKCFGALDWYHLLAPRAYEQWYTREDLLTAPAYQVREWENGVIELMTYENPLSYDTPESRQSIIEVSRYLAEHQKHP